MTPVRPSPHDQQGEKKERSECLGEEDVWVRKDYDVSNFRMSKKEGPEWHQVYRRVTRDMATGGQIEDVQICGQSEKFLRRQLPEGVKDIQTYLYYDPRVDEFGINGVEDQGLQEDDEFWEDICSRGVTATGKKKA